MSDISMGARPNRSVSRPIDRVGTVAVLLGTLILLAAATARPVAAEADGYQIESPSQSELVIGVEYASGDRSPGRASNPYVECAFELHDRDQLADHLIDNQRWGGEFATVGAYDPERFAGSATWWSAICPLGSQTRFSSGQRVAVWTPGEVVPVDVSLLVEHAIDRLSIGPVEIRTAPSGRSDQPYLANLPVGFTLIPEPVPSVSGTASAGPLTITAAGVLTSVTFDTAGQRTACAPPLPSMDELVHRLEPACSLTFFEPGEISITAGVRYSLSYTCSTPCDLTDAPSSLTATAAVNGVVAEAIGVRN